MKFDSEIKTTAKGGGSVGDKYVTNAMNPEGDELLYAVRDLNIKPEMEELITYVKILVDKQDDIVSRISNYGGAGHYAYSHGGGSSNNATSNNSMSNIPDSKIQGANGNKAGNIKNDHKRELEKAYKIARAEGFA